MHRIPVPLIRRDESHDAHPAENTAWSSAPMTWACRTPEAARVVAAVFAGDYAASPRAARRYVPWSRARAIRDARALLAAMHPDTARDVAEAMAR